MPNDQFSSHVVLPIKGIGYVAVPRGTPAADLHAAVLSHPAYQSPNPPDLTFGPVTNVPQDDSIDDRAAVRAQNFARNKGWSKPGPYVTKLNPAQEQQFQTWVKTNKIPWTDTPDADYDMRGYWHAKQVGNPNAVRGSNLHFPDTWKTPYDADFSNYSQYATKGAPVWVGDQLVVQAPVDVGNGSDIPPISVQDALENTSAFRNAARRAWGITESNAMRGNPTEAGFTTDADGSPSKISQHTGGINPDSAGGLAQVWYDGTGTAFHTHPPVPGAGQRPSAADVAIAEREKRPVLVASKDGLFEIDALGNIRQVFKALNWTRKVKK